MPSKHLINMKNLKLSTILVAAILFLSSCNQFIQLIETESVGKDAVTKEGVCQNEDLKISYDMWSEDGITYFSIYNKTDKPMYIDWKRSVFIFNDWKYDYWVEKSTTESYVVPSGYGNNVTFERKTSTVVAERYTFVPPHTNVSVPMTYTIMSGFTTSTSTTAGGKTTITVAQGLKYEDKTLKKVSIPASSGKGTTKAYVKEYSKDNSPARFRNFLTYSFDEKFVNEKFIQNEFYVSKKTEMTKKNFDGPYKKANIAVKVGGVKTKNKVKIYQSPYRAGTSWYNTIIK